MIKNAISIISLIFLLVIQTAFLPELFSAKFTLNLVFIFLFVMFISSKDFHKVLVYSLVIGMFLDVSYFLPIGTTPLILSIAFAFCDKLQFKRTTILLTFAFVCFAYSILINGPTNIFINISSALFSVCLAYIFSLPKQRQSL